MSFFFFFFFFFFFLFLFFLLPHVCPPVCCVVCSGWSGWQLHLSVNVFLWLAPALANSFNRLSLRRLLCRCLRLQLLLLPLLHSRSFLRLGLRGLLPNVTTMHKKKKKKTKNNRWTTTTTTPSSSTPPHILHVPYLHLSAPQKHLWCTSLTLSNW